MELSDKPEQTRGRSLRGPPQGNPGPRLSDWVSLQNVIPIELDWKQPGFTDSEGRYLNSKCRRALDSYVSECDAAATIDEDEEVDSQPKRASSDRWSSA